MYKKHLDNLNDFFELYPILDKGADLVSMIEKQDMDFPGQYSTILRIHQKSVLNALEDIWPYLRAGDAVRGGQKVSDSNPKQAYNRLKTQVKLASYLITDFRRSYDKIWDKTPPEKQASIDILALAYAAGIAVYDGNTKEAGKYYNLIAQRLYDMDPGLRMEARLDIIHKAKRIYKGIEQHYQIYQEQRAADQKAVELQAPKKPEQLGLFN